MEADTSLSMEAATRHQASVVDGGAAVNLMSYVTLRKLGLGEEDLIQTDMMLTDFEGDVSPARGAIRVDLTIEKIGFMPTVAFHLQCTNA